MPIRVLLIEDHHVFRLGLRYVLDRSEGIEVVGEAPDCDTGMEMLRTAGANVVVLDLDLPDASGIELLEAVRDASGGAAVLVVSGYDDYDWAVRVLQAGGHGFVDKSAQFEEIVAAVRAVHAGRRLMSISEQGQMLRRDPSADTTSRRPESAALSEREQEVLNRLARGLTNQQVADELFLSVKTIETYRSRLMRKLGLSSRSELFEYARETGLLAT